MKKFFVGLLIVFLCSFAAIAHAEEVNPYSYPGKLDPYFEWEIKNLDDYQNYALLKKMGGGNGVIGVRNFIYNIIVSGRYFEATMPCRFFEAYQKTLFGFDYFDESFTELTAKLYLMSDELDEAERQINFLVDNAQDNLTRIRALNLKSDLLNRRGNYNEALQITQEVEKLLKDTPDEKLKLVNLSLMARAYCELGENPKAASIFNALNPTIQDTFGGESVENFYLASTAIKLCQHAKNYDRGKEWLQFKASWTPAQNLSAVAELKIESADFYFEMDDAAQGEEMLTQALSFTEALNGAITARKLYKDINRIAIKNLGENHHLALNSEFGFVYVNSSTLGQKRQAIEFYEENLPKFKKAFGEDNVNTLDMMMLLSEDYLSLGKYEDAKKIAEEKLRVCKKYFGTHDERTISSTIDLANIYCRMGKYKTADKLLEDIRADNREFFEQNPAPECAYDFLSTKANSARLKGNIIEYGNYLQNMDDWLEKNSPLYNVNFLLDGHGIPLFLEIHRYVSMTGTVNNATDIEKYFVSYLNATGFNYHPEFLRMMNDVAEFLVKYGNLKDAERYTKQILKLNRTHFGENNLCEWMALNTLSKIRRAEGNFTEALEIDNRALRIAETVCGKKSLERMQSLDSIAGDHSAEGKFGEAIKIRERTLAEYKKILEDSDAATVQMMTNLAKDYVAAKRYADAIKLCDATLALQKVPAYTNNHISYFPSVTELFRSKATAQKLSGDNKNAYENYKNLILVYEAIRAAESRLNPYLSTEENKSKWFADIVPVYKDAAEVSATIGDINFSFYCTEFCKARTLVDSFNDVLLSKNYLLTSDEKKQLVENQILLEAAQNVSEYAATMNDDSLSFACETVYDDIRLVSELYKGELREKYFNNNIKKDLNDLPIKIKEKTNLGAWDLLNQNALEKMNIWNWDAILKNFEEKKNQSIIPQGACLIEFMKVSEDSLLITFLRRGGDVQAANIPVDKRFFEQCELYHDLNSYSNISEMNVNEHKYLWQVGDDYVIGVGRENKPVNVAVQVKAKDDEEGSKWRELRQNICAELSEKLMPTLEKLTGNSTHWIISPDAELNLVPFETLLYHERMLVESVDVSYVPSLAVMNLMEKRGRRNAYLGRSKELFAMGDAIYDTDEKATQDSQRDFSHLFRGSSLDNIDIKSLQTLKWNKLKSAALELDKVSPLFTSKEVLRQEQVTEKNLWNLNRAGELSKYKYMLFSTHGLFVPGMPEYSSIVLSQNFNDEDFDGYVTVGEWTNYDLRSDLIYLSACESGRGDYQAGEGIIGIPYALTVAGNKDTVMSLWKVKDNGATAGFISAVFEKLREGKSEVTALNETKREFLKQNDPSIWAAFLLYGI